MTKKNKTTVFDKVMTLSPGVIVLGLAILGIFQDNLIYLVTGFSLLILFAVIYLQIDTQKSIEDLSDKIDRKVK